MLAIDATAQLTRTELNLIREIARRAGPDLAGLAVIGIDDVAPAERDDVLATIRRRIADLLDPLDVVVVADAPERTPLVRILELGDAAPARSDLQFWASIVEMILAAEAVREVAVERNANIGQTLQASADGRAALSAEDGAAEDQWLEVRLHLRAKSGQFADTAARAVRQSAQSIGRSLSNEMRSAPDKVAWIQERLIDRVHAGLLRIADECEAMTAAQFESAIAAVSPLGLSGRAPEIPWPNDPDLEIIVTDALAPLQRRDRIRFFAKFGSALVSAGGCIAASLCGTPLPALAPLLNPLVDQSVDELARHNEENTARIIETAVRQVASAFTEDALASMRSAYAELLTEFDHEFSNQRELRRLAVEVDAGESAKDLEHLIAVIDTDISTLRGLL